MQPFHASLKPSNGESIPLRTDGNTLFGRGSRFGIDDRRISRKHSEIVVSSETRSVTVRQVIVSSDLSLSATAQCKSIFRSQK